ncbi:PssD/Cps14F family polysaccharide biosynthesis glycosyltransferase [Pseudomonadota bacterium]
MIGEKQLKICVGASAGGHMNQLLKLLEVSCDWPQKPAFYITTLPQLAEKLETYGRTYVIGECNRLHPLMTVHVFIKAVKLIFSERPDVVITTGSLPLAIVCMAAKFCGAKIVWIDSIANVEKLSMSGAMVRYFADLFLTQWPELARKYKNTEYVGTLL